MKTKRKIIIASGTLLLFLFFVPNQTRAAFPLNTLVCDGVAVNRVGLDLENRTELTIPQNCIVSLGDNPITNGDIINNGLLLVGKGTWKLLGTYTQNLGGTLVTNGDVIDLTAGEMDIKGGSFSQGLTDFFKQSSATTYSQDLNIDFGGNLNRCESATLRNVLIRNTNSAQLIISSDCPFTTFTQTSSQTIGPLDKNTSQLVQSISGASIAVPTIISAISALQFFQPGVSLLNYLVYLFISLLQFFRIRKKPKPWGTVYDSETKRPLPFARVQIINSSGRLLQTAIADANGRFGFLFEQRPLSSEEENVSIQAEQKNYIFPSKRQPSENEKIIYPKTYFGGPVRIGEGIVNLDIPMDPVNKKTVKFSSRAIIGVKLNKLFVTFIDTVFWIGLVLSLITVVLQPNLLNFLAVAILVLSFTLRFLGFRLKPFGMVKNKQTKEILPFSYVILNKDGKRSDFGVADQKGRYFILTQRGDYELVAYTPANMVPARTLRTDLFSKKGWVNKELFI